MKKTNALPKVYLFVWPLSGIRSTHGRDTGEMECWYTKADREPGRKEKNHNTESTGVAVCNTDHSKNIHKPDIIVFISPKYVSFWQPLILTPLAPLSIRKCLTSCSFGLPASPWLLAWAGGVVTLRANPYAPWNELLSLMRKQPGSLSFNTAMAKWGKRYFVLLLIEALQYFCNMHQLL